METKFQSETTLLTSKEISDHVAALMTQEPMDFDIADELKGLEKLPAGFNDTAMDNYFRKAFRAAKQEMKAFNPYSNQTHRFKDGEVYLFYPTINDETYRKGKEKIIKCCAMLTRESDLGVLYGVLVSMGRYIVFKYQDGKLYEQRQRNLNLPKNQDANEVISQEFQGFLLNMAKLLWASFQKNLFE